MGGVLYFIEDPNLVVVHSVVLDGLVDVFFLETIHHFHLVCTNKNKQERGREGERGGGERGKERLLPIVSITPPLVPHWMKGEK